MHFTGLARTKLRKKNENTTINLVIWRHILNSAPPTHIPVPKLYFTCGNAARYFDTTIGIDTKFGIAKDSIDIASIGSISSLARFSFLKECHRYEKP